MQFESTDTEAPPDPAGDVRRTAPDWNWGYIYATLLPGLLVGARRRFGLSVDDAEEALQVLVLGLTTRRARAEKTVTGYITEAFHRRCITMFVKVHAQEVLPLSEDFGTNPLEFLAETLSVSRAFRGLPKMCRKILWIRTGAALLEQQPRHTGAAYE